MREVPCINRCLASRFLLFIVSDIFAGGSSAPVLEFDSEVGGGYFAGSWSRDSQKITLVCGSEVNAAALVSITIASSNQISIPATGVLLNQPSLTLATDNPDLPSGPESLIHVEPEVYFPFLQSHLILRYQVIRQL